MMHLRRRLPTSPLPDDDLLSPPMALVDWSVLPEQRLLDGEARSMLDATVAGLPESLRTAFLLRDIEGLSTVEAAGVIGVSPGL